MYSTQSNQMTTHEMRGRAIVVTGNLEMKVNISVNEGEEGNVATSPDQP